MKKIPLSMLALASSLVLLAAAMGMPRAAFADGGTADTMSLTDEPGNWFKSAITGTPFTVIKPGQRVDFEIDNCCTSTKHTVTLLV
ncbi:MAG: hypothetical protein M3Q46_06605, partial [Verrucomicrobiota bacterium]|nr:hypothetical protein [Verrucomicrobiota bacterium]